MIRRIATALYGDVRGCHGTVRRTVRVGIRSLAQTSISNKMIQEGAKSTEINFPYVLIRFPRHSGSFWCFLRSCDSMVTLYGTVRPRYGQYGVSWTRYGTATVPYRTVRSRSPTATVPIPKWHPTDCNTNQSSCTRGSDHYRPALRGAVLHSSNATYHQCQY